MRKILVYLAIVPLFGRLVIVQIYPLLAISIETWDNKDHQ
jgi:ABC-type uncharacterized transport system permease subunit